MPIFTLFYLVKNKFYIYPPTIRQVVTDDSFWRYVKILTMSQEEIEDELVNKISNQDRFPTPFELLLINSYNNKEYEKLAIEAFNCFIHSKVTFLYDLRKIIIGDIETLLP